MNHLELAPQDPQQLVELYSADWNAEPRDIADIGLPFRIRPSYPNIKHFMRGEVEYLLVKSPEPYNPADVWGVCSQDYKLDAVASADEITAFEVNSELITLPALMNDAISIEGKPKLVVKAFKEIGKMLRTLNDTSLEIRGVPITPDLQLGDVAFIKGEKLPLLLPPFNLDAGSDLSEVVSDLSFEISQTPLNKRQRAVARQALVALEVQLV